MLKRWQKLTYILKGVPLPNLIHMKCALLRYVIGPNEDKYFCIKLHLSITNGLNIK